MGLGNWRARPLRSYPVKTGHALFGCGPRLKSEGSCHDAFADHTHALIRRHHRRRHRGAGGGDRARDAQSVRDPDPRPDGDHVGCHDGFGGRGEDRRTPSIASRSRRPSPQPEGADPMPEDRLGR